MDLERYYLDLFEMLTVSCKKIAAGKFTPSDAETSAQGIILAVLDSVEEFRGPGEPEDDITLMAVKVNG